MIEQDLIDIVNNRSLAFVLQDLLCSKCHGVSSEFVGGGCGYTGSLILWLTTKIAVNLVFERRQVSPDDVSGKINYCVLHC